MYTDVSELLAPTVARARAALIAAETALVGLSAGTAIALALVIAAHGSAVEPLVRPALWLGGATGVLALVISIAGRALEIGEAPRRPAVLGRLWRPLIAASASCTAGQMAAALSDASGPFAPRIALIISISAALGAVALGCAALRAHLVTAPPATVEPMVATTAQTIGHSLLAGLAGLLLIGLLTGKVTAGLTYHLGVAITALASVTAMSTAATIRGFRAKLTAGRAKGTRWPLAEHGYRFAAVTMMIGVLLPSVVVIADLLAARVTLLAVACAVLAVSSHALRYALCITALAMPVRTSTGGRT